MVSCTLDFEMAATDELIGISLDVNPSCGDTHARETLEADNRGWIEPASCWLGYIVYDWD